MSNALKRRWRKLKSMSVQNTSHSQFCDPFSSASVYISTSRGPDLVNGHIRNVDNWPPKLRRNTPTTENTKTTIPHGIPVPTSSTALSETMSAMNQPTVVELTMVSVDSTSGPDTDINSSRATPVTALESPSSSSASSPVPSSPSSSSSPSTDASSYSITQEEDQRTCSVDDAPKRDTGNKHQAAINRPDAGSINNSLRPLGPRHLEHDYKVARKKLSAAVAIAVNELFGFSVPVRNEETEAKRPGKECIPLLRQHSLVRRAASAVDEADRLLEEALARGENWASEIPKEWEWSEKHPDYEWAYNEPEAETEKKARRMKARIDLPKTFKPRTRTRKRQTPEVEEDEASDNKEANPPGPVDDAPQLRTKSTDPALCTTIIGSLHERERPSQSRSVSAPDSDPSSALAVIAESDEPPAPVSEKRNRGRPRRAIPDTSGSVMEMEATAVTTQSPVLGSSMMRFRLDPPKESKPPPAPPVKRKRGRPRKHPLPPPVPTLDQLPKNAAAAMVTQESERRSSKRRKIVIVKSN
ncbi:hypothetical protein ACEPAG_4267 [Sanghuangporus baumii]